MKTWTLVWFLVFPPNDAGQTTWELHSATDITEQTCYEWMAAKDEEFRMDVLDGKIIGHEIYCKNNGPVNDTVGEAE